MRIIEHTVEHSGSLKQILKNELHMTSGFITKLKYHGRCLLIDGKDLKINEPLSVGERIIIECPKTETVNIPCVSGNLDILYEDEDVLCVNKPSNMPTHPSLNHKYDTLANIVYNYLKESQDEIHIVTRLDSYTSGIVLIAKNSYSASIMCTKEYNSMLNKEYIGICRGSLSLKSGVIELPIGRCNDSIIKRCVSNCGKYAKTEYELIKEIGDKSVVKFKLYTGRTHQIRVHTQSIGNPLFNDFLYDDNYDETKYFRLHCQKLVFPHPLTRKTKTVSAKLPKQFYDDII